MKKRYLISAGIMAACAGIGLGLLAMLPPTPGVTKANFDRIQNGMTRKQVEAIFGRPCDGSIRVDVDEEFWFAGESRNGGLEFYGATISFRDDRKVGGAFHPLWHDELDSLFARLWRKLTQ